MPHTGPLSNSQTAHSFLKREPSLTSDIRRSSTGNEDAARRPIELNDALFILITMIIFSPQSEEESKHELNAVCVSGGFVG